MIIPPLSRFKRFNHNYFKNQLNIPWFFNEIAPAYIFSRLGLILVGVMALATLPFSTYPGVWQFSANPFINMWSRWDAGWYLSIAEKGYSYHPGVQSNINFAPLYPVIMGAACRMFHGYSHEDMLLAGIILSNVSLIVAIIFLYSLVKLDFNDRISARATLFLLVFPSTLFLSAVYPESLYLALTLIAFYNARRGVWLLAGVFGGLAALTRPYGVILVVPFLYEYMDQRNFRLRSVRWDILGIGLTVAIFSVWPCYLYKTFGKPFLFLTSQSYWHRTPAPPWTVIANFFSAPLTVHEPGHSLIDLSFTILSIALIIYSIGIMRGSYVVYAGLAMLCIISSGLLVSMMRYDLDIFPLFISLALLGRHRGARSSVTTLFACLSGFFMAAFALW